MGIEQSRRDDLEALGYVLLYLGKGSLPWQGLKAQSKKQKYERIGEKKMATPVEVLCKGFPSEFATYLNYTKSLRFDDKPDYAYLRKLLRDLFIREGFEYDCIFDWTMRQDSLNQISPPVISSPISVLNNTSSMAVETTPAPGSDKDEKQKGKEPERKGLKIFRSKDREKLSTGSPTRDNRDDKMDESPIKDSNSPFIKRFSFLPNKKKQEEETKKKGGSGKE